MVVLAEAIRALRRQNAKNGLNKLLCQQCFQESCNNDLKECLSLPLGLIKLPTKLLHTTQVTTKCTCGDIRNIKLRDAIESYKSQSKYNVKQLLCKKCISSIAIKQKFQDPNYSSKIQKARKSYWEKEDYRNNRILSTDEFIYMANRVHGLKYDYTKIDLKNDKITIICKIHGPFIQRPQHHLSLGNGCPRCASENRSSSYEQELVEYLNRNNGLIIKRNVLDVLKYGEIDIYIENMKLGIEIHGAYWHSYNRPETALEKYRHYRKATMAHQANIKLMQIFDFELYNQNGQINGIILSMINHRLGKDTRHFARNTLVQKIDRPEANRFFRDFHLHGSISFDECYALVNKQDQTNCLIAVSFKHRGDDVWEVMRCASAHNVTVIGGLSKLIEHFRSAHNPRALYTYANRRYASLNSGYEKSGMKLESITRPNYFYIYGNRPIIKTRLACQKHKLSKFLKSFDNNLTEHENMFMNGWRRVWDAGNFKFRTVFR